MKYQVIEKEIYSEAMLLHFGEKYELGEIVNEQFPDYSGVLLGNPIFESEDLEKVEEKKKQLEIKRLKIAPINAFFDDDELAAQFYTSKSFTQLQELYKNEFKLALIRRTHNEMMVESDDFYIPAQANDEQIMQIQQLLGFYFFEIKTTCT